MNYLDITRERLRLRLRYRPVPVTVPDTVPDYPFRPTTVAFLPVFLSALWEK